MSCLRQNNLEGQRICTLVMSDFLEGKRKMTAEGADKRSVEKSHADARTYDALFDVASLKGAIKQSMVDLAAASWAMDTGYLPHVDWLRVATVMMVGIIFVGAQRGRPGEWKTVQKATIKMSYLAVA